MDPLSLTVALASLVFSGIALVVTFLQYGLAETQTSVARRQAQIAEEQQAISKAQHEFWDREQKKRAGVRIEPGWFNANAVEAYIDLYLKNDGEVELRELSWDVVLPGGTELVYAVDQDNKPLEQTLPSNLGQIGLGYMIHSGFFARPILPGERQRCGRLVFQRADVWKPIVNVKDIEWAVRTTRGAFPVKKEDGIYPLGELITGLDTKAQSS